MVQVAVPQFFVQTSACAGVPGSLLIALWCRSSRVITTSLQHPLPHSHVLVMLLSLCPFCLQHSL